MPSPSLGHGRPPKGDRLRHALGFQETAPLNFFKDVTLQQFKTEEGGSFGADSCRTGL